MSFNRLLLKADQYSTDEIWQYSWRAIWRLASSLSQSWSNQFSFQNFVVFLVRKIFWLGEGFSKVIDNKYKITWNTSLGVEHWYTLNHGRPDKIFKKNSEFVKFFIIQPATCVRLSFSTVKSENRAQPKCEVIGFEWTFKNKTFSRQIYIPLQFDQSALAEDGGADQTGGGGPSMF